MKGDFSRFVVPAPAASRGVLLQQGRAQLDSDWAAHFAMREALARKELADVIGPAGAPRAAAGFGLEVVSGELVLTAGRYYVDGILCETGRVPLREQPFLPGEPARVSGVAYLDVWPRTRALPGSDALAVEAVWQVRLTADERESGPASGRWHPPDRRPSNARLEVRASHPDALGDQLYRVEMHAQGEKDERRRARTTWKWSRANAAIAFPIVAVVPAERNVVVEVEASARHVALQLKPGQWMEVVDDAAELRHEGHPLWQVAGIEPTRDPRVARIALIRSAPVDLPPIDPGHPPLLRAWDHQATARAPLAAGAVPLVANEWVPLERGVEVRFTAPEEGELPEVHPGDFWLFSTRAHRGVEWPDGGAAADAHPPAGIDRVYARLARVTYDRGAWRVTRDLRRLFDPLAARVDDNDALLRRVEMLERKLAAVEGEL